MISDLDINERENRCKIRDNHDSTTAGHIEIVKTLDLYFVITSQELAEPSNTFGYVKNAIDIKYNRKTKIKKRIYKRQ
jgi:hypothetical protein